MEFEFDVYTVAWHLTKYSIYFAIVEFIGVHIFQKLFYKLGFLVFRQSYDLGSYKIHKMPRDVIKMDEGKFKFINSNECLFTSKLHLFKFCRLKSPFYFKGTAIWNQGNIEFYGRLPMGTTLFWLFFLVGWTAPPWQAAEIFHVLFGWVFVGLIIAGSLPTEKKRMEEMINEFKMIIEEKACGN